MDESTGGFDLFMGFVDVKKKNAIFLVQCVSVLSSRKAACEVSSFSTDRTKARRMKLQNVSS